MAIGNRCSAARAAGGSGDGLDEEHFRERAYLELAQSFRLDRILKAEQGNQAHQASGNEPGAALARSLSEPFTASG